MLVIKLFILLLLIICLIYIIYDQYYNNYLIGSKDNFLPVIKYVYNNSHYKNYKKFNPSLIYDKDENCFHVIVRVCNYTLIDPKFVLFHLTNSNVKSYNLYQKMNPSLTHVYSSHIINIDDTFYNNNSNKNKFQGLEDARIIRYKKEYYIYGTWRNQNLISNIMLIKLDNNFNVSEQILFYDDQIQKNWISIINNDKLYFIKWIYPFELLLFDDNSKTVKPVFKDENNNNNNLKDLRGGSQTIEIKEGYLAITHIQGSTHQYYHQFILFDKTFPFKPIAVSNNFTIEDNFDKLFFVEFANGLSLSDKENEIIVTYGRFDALPKFKKYKLNEILLSLK